MGLMQYEMINVIESGNMFGELGIIYNRPRAATCFALTDIEYGVMNKQEFNFCFGEFQKQEEKNKVQFINRHIITDGQLQFLSTKFGIMFSKKYLLRGNVILK